MVWTTTTTLLGYLMMVVAAVASTVCNETLDMVANASRIDREERLVPVAATCLDLEERVELLEARFARYHDEDELSVVELATRAVRRFVGSRLLPRSDGACRWHYAKAVCVPKCECELRYRAGDITPSRACRRRRRDESRIDDCDADLASEPGALVKASRSAVQAVEAIGNFIRDAAPATDTVCTWSWRKFRCSPGCRLAYQFGDYNLRRACRRAPDLDPTPQDAPAISSPEDPAAFPFESR